MVPFVAAASACCSTYGSVAPEPPVAACAALGNPTAMAVPAARTTAAKSAVRRRPGEPVGDLDGDLDGELDGDGTAGDSADPRDAFHAGDMSTHSLFIEMSPTAGAVGPSVGSPNSHDMALRDARARVLTLVAKDNIYLANTASKCCKAGIWRHLGDLWACGSGIPASSCKKTDAACAPCAAAAAAAPAPARPPPLPHPRCCRRRCTCAVLAWAPTSVIGVLLMKATQMMYRRVVARERRRPPDDVSTWALRLPSPTASD